MNDNFLEFFIVPCNFSGSPTSLLLVCLKLYLSLQKFYLKYLLAFACSFIFKRSKRWIRNSIYVGRMEQAYELLWWEHSSVAILVTLCFLCVCLWCVLFVSFFVSCSFLEQVISSEQNLPFLAWDKARLLVTSLVAWYGMKVENSHCLWSWSLLNSCDFNKGRYVHRQLSSLWPSSWIIWYNLSRK